MIIQKCFQIAGYSQASYCFADNGLEAFTSLENNRTVDLIVTDLNMPKMDGENFIKRLKTNPGNGSIPVLVISSVGDSAVENTLNGLGVLGIIKKPISPAKILEVLGG
jgi:two-component system chemotaxis response regulator CheY